MGLYFDAPEAPNPQETASAQMGQNVNTAIANANLQNVNQRTPYGNLTYDQTGTYQMTDPNSGEVYNVPRFTATQSLSPTQQRLFDYEQAAKENMAHLAVTQSSRLEDVLGQNFDLSSLPARNNYDALPTYGVQAPTMNYGPALNFGQNLTTGQNLNTSGAYGGNIISTFGQTKSKIPTVLPTGPNTAGLGTIQKSLDQSKIGAINPTFSGGGGVLTEFGDAGPITKTYNTDFSEDRRRVEEAIYARLNPQLDRGKEALRTLRAQALAAAEATRPRATQGGLRLP